MKYHTNQPPRGEPIVNPMSNAQALASAQASAKTTADRYFDNSTTPLPQVDLVEQPAAAPTKAPATMSNLARLAEALNAIPAQVEADAEAALTRLIGAKEKASAATGKIHNVAGKIEDTAKSIEDFANQITNGGPPL